MKTLLTALALAVAIAFPNVARAAGLTSVAEIDNVTEVKVEDGKITIKGSAVFKRRTVSTGEKADDSVFGGPAQWLHAKVREATFVVVPYHTEGIHGVSTGGHTDENLRKGSERQWAKILPFAKSIKKGDKVRILYQGDKTTINGYYVTEVIGYGHVEALPEKDS